MVRIITITLPVFLLGAVGGIGAGYFWYQPQIDEFNSQITVLNDKVHVQEQTITSLVIVEEKLNKDVAWQQIEISQLEGEKANLRVQQRKLETDLRQAQTQVNDYKIKLSDSLERTDDILGITVNQFYSWPGWAWELSIPLSLYVEYLERPRPQPSYFASWVNLATDLGDDSFIQSLTNEIRAITSGYSDTGRLNWVISFVQNLPYTVDSETTPYDEYPRYPMETLFDRGGDCEDTSILVAALLDNLGYDVVLLFMEKARHVAVGVDVSNAFGTYYEYGGVRYYYLETTGKDWQVGELPPGITDTDTTIIPVQS